MAEQPSAYCTQPRDKRLVLHSNAASKGAAFLSRIAFVRLELADEGITNSWEEHMQETTSVSCWTERGKVDRS
jgi:hypothetical protein